MHKQNVVKIRQLVFKKLSKIHNLTTAGDCFLAHTHLTFINRFCWIMQ